MSCATTAAWLAICLGSRRIAIAQVLGDLLANMRTGSQGRHCCGRCEKEIFWVMISL